MKRAGRRPSSRPAASRELAGLRARLAEAEETLGAIRAGEVDAIVVAGKRGAKVFTLEGTGNAYRVLIESMSEGALTLTADKTILYANRRFAEMVRCPLERLIGGSFRRFLSVEDQGALRPLLNRRDKSGSKTQVRLIAVDGSQMPVQVSIRRLAKADRDLATIAIVVTDMTEARRNESMLRALSRRLVQAQEAERGQVALELHDHITQLLCAILFRYQALAGKLSASDEPSNGEATRLREMLGGAAEEVERISRNLRPGVLDELGLVDALGASSAEFGQRTGVSVELACVRMTARLPADTELTLYRIFQEALENVEKHARARHVAVRLGRQAGFVRLAIHDDGIGFDPNRHAPGRRERIGLGLLSMRERATHLGGTLEVTSTRRAGTKIEVRIPLSPGVAASGRADARPRSPSRRPNPGT